MRRYSWSEVLDCIASGVSTKVKGSRMGCDQMSRIGTGQSLGVRSVVGKYLQVAQHRILAVTFSQQPQARNLITSLISCESDPDSGALRTVWSSDRGYASGISPQLRLSRSAMQVQAFAPPTSRKNWHRVKIPRAAWHDLQASWSVD